jgi:D-alanyl-D-alanine carboxypeptidase-like protein
LVTLDASAEASGEALPEAAIATADAGEPDGGVASTSACNEQPPQDFLIRGTFLRDPKGNARAIQWRTDTYGYFKGYGKPASDAKPATASVVSTTFMGLPVRMHRKVVPALACVEQEIKVSCADHPYTPHVLAGIRYRNTYRGGEVTNHAFGIAIDVDPAINTCCGCVPPWNDAPACHKAVKSEYDRMAMPECWVHAFERYGFYWLGHDVLKDTMHFEFLGDPDRILRAPSSPQASAP